LRIDTSFKEREVADDLRAESLIKIEDGKEQLDRARLM